MNLSVSRISWVQVSLYVVLLNKAFCIRWFYGGLLAQERTLLLRLHATSWHPPYCSKQKTSDMWDNQESQEQHALLWRFVISMFYSDGLIKKGGHTSCPGSWHSKWQNLHRHRPLTCAWVDVLVHSKCFWIFFSIGQLRHLRSDLPLINLALGWMEICMMF